MSLHNQHVLDDDLQNIHEAVSAYQRERLFQHQRRRDFRQVANLVDGRYSLTRLLNSQLQDSVHRLAPYEHSESERIAEQIGRQPRPGHSFVPLSRDLTANVAGAGGHLVETEVAPGDRFTGYLNAASIAAPLGIERIPMTGNASLPSTSGSVTAGWLATESTQVAGSDFSFSTSAATPKTVGSYTVASRQWLQQGSQAAGRFVFQEMARATAGGLDSKLINGDGAGGRPTGILQTPGVGSIAGASLAWGGVLDALDSVESGNALVNPQLAAWLVAPDVARLLRARERSTGSGFILSGGRIAGFPTVVSNAIPAGTMLFGDWSGVALMEWSILEVGADPYGDQASGGQLFKSARVGLRALWTADVVVTRPASFCQIVGIT